MAKLTFVLSVVLRRRSQIRDTYIYIYIYKIYIYIVQNHEPRSVTPGEGAGTPARRGARLVGRRGDGLGAEDGVVFGA